MKKITVVVTGAAGSMAYSFLFRLASGEVFGPDVLIDLHLLELESALLALDGVRMELEDCAYSLLNKIVCTSDAKTAMTNIDWAFLIGASRREANMERSDLLLKNAAIFQEQGKAINEFASSDVKVLVVGNPCNTNALITMRSAPDVPRDRFFAMTLLDEHRARYQLAAKIKCPMDHVQNLIVWGNHSLTQFPDFYHATINHKPVLEVVSDEAWFQHDFLKTIQQRGSAIIKARGVSSSASAAHAIIKTTINIVSKSTLPFSLAVCSNGEYEVDPGLIFSFPCFMQDGQLKIVHDIQHNEFANKQIQLTLDELRREKQMFMNIHAQAR